MATRDAERFAAHVTDDEALRLHRALARRCAPLYAKMYRREYEMGVRAAQSKREAVSPTRETGG